MKSAAYITRNEPIPALQDFEQLRQSAIEHIQKLCGDIWTDHNLHDPGITNLEVLVYALMDLSYRTQLPIADLLTRRDGSVRPVEISGLFGPEQILPGGPVTEDDLRRLLLKIGGIRNAWCKPLLDTSADVPLYFDRATSKLEYAADASSARFAPVFISGLYRVLLELEIDDELGNLNEMSISDRVLDHAPLRGALIEVSAQDPATTGLRHDRPEDFQSVGQVQPVVARNDGSFITSALLKLENGQIELGALRILVAESTTAVTPDLLGDWLISDQSPLPRLWRKYQLVWRIVARARCALSANRGLTEDYLDIAPVPADRLGLCADIDVDPSADLEAVKAEVIQRVDQYLNPPVTVTSLGELLAQGVSTEQIFNGPYIDWTLSCDGQPVFSQPGFVAADSLKESTLRETVYASDLIEILVRIDGVTAVRNVAIRRPGHGPQVADEVDRWCLAVRPFHQPRLDPGQSRFRFFKDGMPYRVRTDEFELSLAQLRSQARAGRLVVGDDLLVRSQGTFREPAAFYSVANDLPLLYGVGKAGLHPQASPRRVAQAQQLKAYLTLFDQILANYLAQLSRLEDLLSLDPDLDRTFFAARLTPMLGVRGAFDDEIFVDKTDMADVERRNELLEDDVRFATRRNQALDHLIARFAESFTDYVFMTYDLEGDRLHSDQVLINKKITFAREYPHISRRRGSGLDYSAAPSWDTQNVSGLEQRVCRLLGIDNYARRDLFCEAVLERLFRPRRDGGQVRMEIKNAANQVLFSSEQTFADEQAMRETALKYYDRLNEASSFQIEKVGDDAWTYTIASSARDDSLRHRARFASRREAVEKAHGVIKRHADLLTSNDICSDEGFHLIEHVLLRPKAVGDPLMTPCLADPGHECGDHDPYSHRVTVLCPSWPGRFSNLAFRRFFERTLRAEAPAHVHARICWISNQDMRRADKLYRQWLDGLRRGLVSEPQRRRRLIDFLAHTESVYPPAQLHDCEDDTDTSVPTKLDETKLGLF